MPRTGQKKSGGKKKHSNAGVPKKGGGKKSGNGPVAFGVSKSSTNPFRENTKGSTQRTKATIKRLNMYKKKISANDMALRHKVPDGMQRIQPDRRWFGNTRVITQDKMTAFRQELSKSVDDPYSVVIKSSKLPMALLTDPEKESRMKLLQIDPFANTFGKKAQRKRPTLAAYDLDEMMKKVEDKAEKYDTSAKVDRDLIDVKTEHQRTGESLAVSEEIFKKGTSRRIWQELYKVIDSSDIILEIIDARDPMGTRCRALERETRKKHPHKHIVIVLNKCDLVPTWVTKRWVRILSKDYPTVAFHASITNPFGKATLLQLLRQYAGLMKEKKHVSIGLVGFPNAGKSSVINALKRKKVCKAAPIPGETKVWQYVSLTKRIFMIDCPGVVPPSTCAFEEDCAKVFRGVVRIERVEAPSVYIDEVLNRVKKEYLIKRYKLPQDVDWADGDGFLSVLGVKMGKLRKGGEPDLETVARIVLYDWQRGRIPFFTMPPRIEEGKEEEEEPVMTEIQSEHAKQVDTSQDMGELKCALEFDEADTAKPADQPESEDEAAKPTQDAPKKKKRKRTRNDVDDDEEASEEKKKMKMEKINWDNVHDEFGA